MNDSVLGAELDLCRPFRNAVVDGIYFQIE